MAALPTYRAQLATLVEAPPGGDGWLHELKYDGYRMGLLIEGGQVRLVSRRGKEWTSDFPELVTEARRLPVRTALIDGEVTVVLPDGRTSFQALQNAFSGAPRTGLAFFAFDLLHLDGRDLGVLPLELRKAELQRLLEGFPSQLIRYSQHFLGEGPEVFRQACALGAEGIISKRRDLPYRPGRNDTWVKTKCVLRQEFVVGGFTDPEGSRQGVGSLLVGYHGEGGRLVFAGKVGTGTGFTQKFSRALRQSLQGLEQQECPFSPRPSGWLGQHAHWVRPELVAEVAFTEWTEGGHLRHPALRGFRDDKRPEEIVREQPRSASPPAAAPARPRPGGLLVAGVRISHPDRLIYPALGVTKADLARYCVAIAPWILPHLEGRPLTLVRCHGEVSAPDALRSQCEFLHHDERSNAFAPASIPRVAIQEQKKVGEYLRVESLSSLLVLVNAGIIELHVWNSRLPQLEEPDRLVFDLDPAPELPWAQVVAAARKVRSYLEALGLRSWVKGTGGKGLHLVVPLAPVAGWDECFTFARAFAQAVALKDPRFITTFGKASRAGKILLDYKRNYRTSIAIAAFSPRARPQGTVALPLSWEELSSSAPSRHTVKTLPRRLSRLKADPWEALWGARQTLPGGSVRLEAR